MAEGEGNGDREAVEETVRAFFSDPHAPDDLLCGPLLEWAHLRGEVPWLERFEQRRTLESAEIREVGERHAVVEVRAEHHLALIRGAREHLIRFDGPVVLEKLDGRWRIADFTVDGRRRLEALVRGPLAEQEQAGVTVRVLGVDRTAKATEYVVEVANAGQDEVRVDQAFALFETQTSWARLNLGPREPIPPGGSATVLLNSGNVLQLTDHTLAVALRLRAGRRKLPFLLKVPLERPESLVLQRPPRTLPMLRSTWPRSLLFYAVVTVASWWWFGWFAIAVPLFVAAVFWIQVRATGSLPERWYRWRYGLDALVVLAIFGVLWETPAAALAVPAVVAALAYGVVRLVSRRRGEAALVIALSVGVGWFLLLGTYDKPLSTCRIADGPPASTADSFARAVLGGDMARARRYESSLLRTADPVVSPPVSRAEADAAVAHRATLDSALCSTMQAASGAVGCYVYRAPMVGEPGFYLATVVCDTKSWHVDEWAAVPG